jgi:hypothetical protein
MLQGVVPRGLRLRPDVDLLSLHFTDGLPGHMPDTGKRKTLPVSRNKYQRPPIAVSEFLRDPFHFEVHALKD